jgi:tetratricopeptide (TPR) repeat protein
LGRYFPGNLFPQLFEEEEKKSAVLFRAFTILSNLGVIDCTEDPIPRIYNFTALAEKMLGERKERIHQFVRNRLLAWIFSGRIRPCFKLLEILAALGSQGADKLILEAICGDVINGTYKEIEQAIKENRFNTLVGGTKGPALYYIFITLKALIQGNEAEIRKAFEEPIPEGNFFSGYKIQILSNLTGYYLGINNLDMASEMIKEAMIIGQGQKHGIAQAYRLFSLVNLVKQHVNDSIDYLSFAVDNTEKSEQFDELGVAAYYAAIAQFLFGNLSKAEQLALKAEQGAMASGRPGWADRARFLQGKLRFEIGYYQDAQAIFSALQQNPADTLSEEMDRILSAWIYRVKVYAGTHPTEGPNSKGADAFLFEVEASYMMGDYKKTIALTQIIPPLPETDFLYTERPDWRSGFAQCELLLLSSKDLWERMIFAYRGLALCRLPATENERKQVISRMQRFTKDELLLDTDPNDIFYFYAYYRILQESGASEIDLSTAISMAFRRLQHRAIRIDDLETRRVFLNHHYWNSTLSIAAKEYKLI